METGVATVPNAVTSFAFDTGTTLLPLARDGKLEPSLKDSAAAGLLNAPWNELRNEAVKLFPLPERRLVGTLSRTGETLTIEESMNLEGENGVTPGCWRRARMEPRLRMTTPPAL